MERNILDSEMHSPLMWIPFIYTKKYCYFFSLNSSFYVSFSKSTIIKYPIIAHTIMPALINILTPPTVLIIFIKLDKH